MSLRSALFAFFLALPSVSDALTLECQLRPAANSGGYVTQRYVFQRDDASSDAIVSDGLILYFNDNQPMAAKVSEETAKKLVFTWSVPITNSTGQITRMLFRAAYFKSDGSITVRGVPGGYDTIFEARGRCRQI